MQRPGPAGERRKVHKERRLVDPARIGQRVGQDQPPLGVGVQNLDRLAVPRRVHVPDALRVLANHVFDQRHEHHEARVLWQPVGRLDPEIARQGHRHAAPGLVAIHAQHARARFQIVPAAVKHHALAHGANRPLASPNPSAHFQNQKMRGMRPAAVAHGKDQTESLSLQLGPVQHSHLDPRPGPGPRKIILHHPAKARRMQLVGRLARQPVAKPLGLEAPLNLHQVLALLDH